MKPLIILKLGGSIITEKDSETPKIRSRVIEQLGRELEKILHLQHYQLVLVHGAGSFGHPLAKKYNLREGMITEEQKFGFCLTDKMMIELNLAIVEKLLKQGLPVVSLPPRSFASQSGKELKAFDLALIKGYLDQNLTPVLFGDVVLDDKQGCSILSGDIIIPYLARSLHASQVIFLSDVEGVFDSNPKQNPQAQLIPEINDENLEEVLSGLSDHNPNDVTGEMRGKVLAIKNNLTGIPVFITSGLNPRALQKIFQGQSSGTKLLFH